MEPACNCTTFAPDETYQIKTVSNPSISNFMGHSSIRKKLPALLWATYKNLKGLVADTVLRKLFGVNKKTRVSVMLS